ncbi:MAG: tetratricopeptide repeat protein [Phycisphaerales bacterium]|nr:tetratricopeptide repeat protein [Phycisphaerales bacterium]
MAMRPRTFRRLILALVFGGVICVGLIGYFVVGPMQQKRSIEELRSTGMKAYEDGDYGLATQNLGRYLRAAKVSSPEELLAFARSRVKVEAGDGGHLRAAISAYRDYLNLRPDDTKASVELLQLFIRDAKWPEAIALGESLRSKPGADLKVVLSEELVARKQKDSTDPQIPELYEQLLALESPDFATTWSYAFWLDDSGRLDEADAFLDDMIATNPDAPGPKVLRELIGGRLPDPSTSNPADVNDLVVILSAIIGWNGDEYRWEDDGPEFGSDDLTKLTARAFDLLGRGDLALEVEGKGAAESGDPLLMGSFARRLWWSFQLDWLNEIDPTNSDLLGYQVLAAQANEDTAGEGKLREKLGAIDTDFRAKGWVMFFEATDLIETGKLVDARLILTKAMSTNPLEPTFHLEMGDLNSRLGREEDAKEGWKNAETLALPLIWVEPTLRLVASLQQSEHLSEAGAVAQMLLRRAPGDSRARLVWLSTQAAMARSGLLSMRQIDGAVSQARRLAGYLSQGERDRLSAHLAVLLLVSGHQDEGVAELRRTLGSSKDALVLNSVIEIDRFFDLGIIDLDAIDTAAVAMQSPYSALGYAHKVYIKEEDREKALGILDEGRNASDQVDHKLWDLVRVQFLDTIRDDRAKGEWETLLTTRYPDDIELKFEAIDSAVLGLDIAFVDATIEQILDLTSSKGRTVPIRLRLARARAIASGKGVTKSKREEALSIVRGVIAIDPRNIRARLMLSNILDLECSPELTGDDRFVRDRAGSAAEKLTILRLIGGAQARDYLFRVSQLHIDLGDTAAARQSLLEAYARSEGDVEAQYMIVLEMRRAGEFELAIPKLGDLVKRSSAPRKGDLQITLARILGGLNQRSQVLSVLVEVAQSETLTRTQLIDLVTLFIQIGNQVEGEQVLADAAMYGLDEQEIQYAQVQYAMMTGSVENAEEILGSMVRSDPTNVDAWLYLARLLGKDGRFDQAKARLEAALVANPGDERVQYDLAMLSGDRDQINRVVSDSLRFEDSNDRYAMQQIVSFEKQREGMTREEIASRLTELGDAFPDMVAVQNYIYEALREVSDDAKGIGAGAEAASRRVGTHAGLLETATRAYIDAGDWVSVLRTTNAWRGVAAGSPISPDLFAARAAYETRDFAKAKELLWPYFETASKQTEEPLYRELLLIYAQASIGFGDPSSQLAAQLEPLAVGSKAFREVVWLQLAANSIPEVQEASRWIELAQSMSDPQSLSMVVEAWLGLGSRFPDHALVLNRNAVEAADQWVASASDDPVALSGAGSALLRSAEALSYAADDREIWLTKARGYFDHAAEIDPDNLGHLFSAARCAGLLQDYSGSAQRYRSVLSGGDLQGLFGAAVRNNLTQMIEQGTDNRDDLGEALVLVKQAVAFQEHPAFLSTLGWIELRLGNQDRAEALFRQVVENDAEDAEGWIGLCASLQATNPTGSSDAMVKFMGLVSPRGVNPATLAHLSRFGIKLDG